MIQQTELSNFANIGVNSNNKKYKIWKNIQKNFTWKTG